MDGWVNLLCHVSHVSISLLFDIVPICLLAAPDLSVEIARVNSVFLTPLHTRFQTEKQNFANFITESTACKGRADQTTCCYTPRSTRHDPSTADSLRGSDEADQMRRTALDWLMANSGLTWTSEPCSDSGCCSYEGCFSRWLFQPMAVSA